MKKISLSIIFSCLALVSAYAAPVSQTEAGKTASAFFGGRTATMVWSETMTKSSVASSYYVFNNQNGGWVIIAGDDCCEPVLAYSNTGTFDSGNLPVNFVSWMESISRNVNKVRKAGLAPKAEIKAKWSNVGGTKAAVSQTLITTASWGQGSPFNLKCPNSSVTGCVATAMSIVLRHYRLPVKGTGTIPAYSTYSKKYLVPAITLGEAYDWDNMPLQYPSSPSTAQKNAVSTLMYHCGAMVEMDYTPQGSGAMSADIIPALTTYMGFSKNARELYRSNYSNSDWFKMIKAEIDADRPMIYGGMDSETGDGHQFVLDGYNSNNMVHINWGWTGSCNAWYAVNYLGDKSSYGVDDVFSYYDSAIFGLVPAGASETAMDVELMLWEYVSGSYDYRGLTLKSGTIAKGSTFTLDIGVICNNSYYYDYNGAINVGLYDKNGKLKEYVGSEKSITIEHINDSGYYDEAYINNYQCKITGNIELGDYLALAYKRANGTWDKVGGVRADEFSSAEEYTIDKLGALGIAMLDLPATATAGQVIYLDLIYSHKLPSKIVWTVNGSTITKRYVELVAGKNTVKAEITYNDGSKETIQRVINAQ